MAHDSIPAELPVPCSAVAAKPGTRLDYGDRTERVVAYETVGNFGTNSCSPVGDGGWTGCSQKLINAAYAEKKQGSALQFGQLIEREREKRLSTLEEEAAAEQSRVEEIEKEHEARQAAEQQAAQGAAEPGAGADQ